MSRKLLFISRGLEIRKNLEILKKLNDCRDHEWAGWGLRFAEIMNGLVDQLKSGHFTAVSEFMYQDPNTFLSGVLVLRV